MTTVVYITLFVLIASVTIISSYIVSKKVYLDEYSKKIKLDITVEQMVDAENRIKCFYLENNLPSNASIWEIAKKLHIKDGGIDNQLTQQAHLSEPNLQGDMVVTFKNGLNVTRKIFNFAHECAHVINNDPQPIDRPDGKNKSFTEQLADYTAAALLMPINEVYDYLVEKKYNQLSPKKRVVLIKALCQQYEVSEVIALRRIKEIYEIKK